jgi:RNA polymerase sigma-70 factor (ECF subfamily)
MRVIQIGVGEHIQRVRNDATLSVIDLDAELVRHHAAAFGWALACCRWDRGAAEDVLQAAYLKLLDGRARYNGTGDFRAFLFGVIRRSAAEERRKRAVRSALSFAFFQSNATNGDTPHPGLDPLIANERQRALIAALGKLSSRQREVLHLVFYQDLSIAAAAGVLSISVGSARVHYGRGKAQLRRLLGEV